MRVVIDTNVLISAIFWAGKPKLLLNSVRRGEITFLTSETLLAELKEVLTSKDKPFRISTGEADKIMNHLKDIAELVNTLNIVAVCRDEDDNRVLECALDGSAEYIITGDKDLLDLKIFKGIKIMSVGDFTDWLCE